MPDQLKKKKKKLDQQIFEEGNMPSKLYYKNMNAAKHSLIFQSYNVALHRGINLCFYS